MISILQFLIPLFGLLTAALVLGMLWHINYIRKHESKSEERHVLSEEQSVYRHNDLQASHEMIATAVEKVGKKIDSEVIPRLSPGFSRKDSVMYKATEQGIQEALELNGLSCESVGNNEELFLVGVQGGVEDAPENFKVYYYLQVDLESQDLLVECYAYEFKSFCEKASKLLLSLNDKFKISGFAIEEVGGRFFLKNQYLLFLNDGFFDAKRLDYSMVCLYNLMKEAVQMLEADGVALEFVEPSEYMSSKISSYAA